MNLKNVVKGHNTVAEQFKQEPLQRQGQRYITRIMCDAYGKRYRAWSS